MAKRKKRADTALINARTRNLGALRDAGFAVGLGLLMGAGAILLLFGGFVFAIRWTVNEADLGTQIVLGGFVVFFMLLVLIVVISRGVIAVQRVAVENDSYVAESAMKGQQALYKLMAEERRADRQQTMLERQRERQQWSLMKQQAQQAALPEPEYETTETEWHYIDDEIVVD